MLFVVDYNQMGSYNMDFKLIVGKVRHCLGLNPLESQVK